MELKEENGLISRRRPLRKNKNFLTFIVYKILFDIGEVDKLKDDYEKNLYSEIKNYLKRAGKRGFINPEYNKRIEFHDVTNKIQRIFARNIYCLPNSDLDKEVAIFIACNIWKILARYSYETVATQEEIEYLVAFTKESNPEENITLKLTDNFWTQYFEDIKSLYEEYINNYQNVECFDLDMLIYTFKDSRLLDINVDNILQEYSNLTRNDVLKLCIYHLSDDLFVKYLNVLNSCSNEEKKMIFEFIKPMHFYFQYAPKYWEIPRSDIDYDLVWKRLEEKLSYIHNYIINNTKENEKKVFCGEPQDSWNIDIQTIMINEEIQSFFQEIYYMGYSAYVAEFENTFLEQIELLSVIIENHNISALQNLLQAKKYLVDNPISTEYIYGDRLLTKEERQLFGNKKKVSLPVSFDKTKILELKNYFLEFCGKLLTNDLEQTPFMKLTKNK